jgi:hypothetical protein
MDCLWRFEWNTHLLIRVYFLTILFTLLSSHDNAYSRRTHGHSAPLGEHLVMPPVMSMLLQVKFEQLDVEPQRI